MKRFYFLFVVCFLFSVLAARAQTYEVTESQMQMLEEICRNYKANNQTLTEQLNESRRESTLLKAQLTDSKKESTLLSEQLQNERKLTQNLNDSLYRSELNAAQIESERDQALLDCEKQKTANQKLQKIIIILACALGTFILGIVAALIFKFIK